MDIRNRMYMPMTRKVEGLENDLTTVGPWGCSLQIRSVLGSFGRSDVVQMVISPGYEALRG